MKTNLNNEIITLIVIELQPLRNDALLIKLIDDYNIIFSII